MFDQISVYYSLAKLTSWHIKLTFASVFLRFVTRICLRWSPFPRLSLPLGAHFNLSHQCLCHAFRNFPWCLITHPQIAMYGEKPALACPDPLLPQEKWGELKIRSVSSTQSSRTAVLKVGSPDQQYPHHPETSEKGKFRCCGKIAPRTPVFFSFFSCTFKPSSKCYENRLWDFRVGFSAN